MHAGVATSAAPTSPSPGRKLSTPCGTPGGEQGLDDARIAHAGDCSAGLRTTALPVARPAATMPHGIANGKFHGPITATTPRAA